MDTAYFLLRTTEVYNLKDLVFTVPGSTVKVGLEAGKKYLLQNQGSTKLFFGEFTTAPPEDFTGLCIEGLDPWVINVEANKSIYVHSRHPIIILVTEV